MEQQTEKKNSKCLYCGNFQAYYTKELHNFERTKQGICNYHNKIVNSEEGCEYWKTNNHRLCLRKRAVTRTLYEILTDLSAIRKIIQENQEEGKNI